MAVNGHLPSADEGIAYLRYKDESIRDNKEYYDFDTWLLMKPVEIDCVNNLMERVPTTHPKIISDERKATPIYAGVLKYFPDAIAAVARLSKKANDKHNPGEPLHWSRNKSSDHAECIIRHQMNPEEIDPEFNELHAVAVAWRALAQLQLLEEKRLGK